MSSPESASPQILVCDDESAARRGIVRALGRSQYRFLECSSGLECLQVLEQAAVDLVLLDLRMPGLDGRATLERILKLPQPPPVIIVTADSQLRTAIETIRQGAADFLAKPYDIEELRWVVERTFERVRLKRQNLDLHRQVRRLRGDGELLGESPVMERLREQIERVAPTEASVLIRGATGTGKELVARELHRLGRSPRGPFVALNCAAVPESLLESELFGHRKGAFTGADRDRPGRFREAHGGTLFLDEIGDMPLSAQAKLLRVLQERKVEPLGGGRAVQVEVRLLAATHRDLEVLCDEERFRRDLYYRLRVVELEVPLLRERGEDIALLARIFLRMAGGRDLSPEACSALASHPWPGNVRELKNSMERAAIFCRDGVVEVGDLPAELRRTVAGTSRQPRVISEGEEWPPGTDFQVAKNKVLESFERRFFRTLLERHQGNISRAAREAGLHRQNLQKKLRSLGVDPASFRRRNSGV